MSDQNSSTVEQTPVDKDTNVSNVDPIQDPAKDSVALETHRRLLAQRKNDQKQLQEANARLAAFEEKENQEEQAIMEKKGEYDKIVKAKDDQILALIASQAADKKARVDSAKEAAFISAIPGKLRKQDYLSFMDKEAIAIDPETGKVDQGSLKQVVDSFVQEHGVLIDRQDQNSKIPNKGATTPNNLLKDPKLSNDDALELLLAQQRNK